jgi:gliding motility-associated-like protein
MENKFEDIIKNSLSNYEADVSPKVWQSVEAGIAGKGAATASSGAKAGKFLGQLGLKSSLWIGSAVLIIGSGLALILVNNPVPSSSTVPEKVLTQTTSEGQLNTQVNSGYEQKSQTIESYHDQPKGGNTIVDGNSSIPVATNAIQQDLTVFKASDADHASKVNNTPENHKNRVSQENNKVTENNISKPNTDQTLDLSSEKPTHVSSSPEFDQIEKYLDNSLSSPQNQLPNIFSPNNDGLNDVFTIKTKGLKSLEVTVFDNSGVSVYRWVSLDGGWNGLLPDGRDAKAGYYYYSVNAVTEEGKICIKQSMLKLVR